MRAHLTSADIAAFRARRLDRAAIESIGAHVRDCAECARLVWSDEGIRSSAQSVWNEPQRARPRLIWAAAAALLLAVAGLAWWWVSRDGPQQAQDDRPPRPPVVSQRVVRDGATAITLDARGAVQNVATSRSEWNDLAATALRTGTPPRAVRTGLTGTGEILRGGGENGGTVTLLEPVGVSVESATPRFRWSHADGPRYRVVIARDGAAIVKSDWLRETTWTPATPLPRGATYAWQLVIADHDREHVVPAPEQPPAYFHVLSETETQELDAARASGSHLVTGLVAARHGLGDLAASELTTFASLHADVPGAAALARHYERPAPTTTNAAQ